jgi:hypothetical protein
MILQEILDISHQPTPPTWERITGGNSPYLPLAGEQVLAQQIHNMDAQVIGIFRDGDMFQAYYSTNKDCGV